MTTRDDYRREPLERGDRVKLSGSATALADVDPVYHQSTGKVRGFSRRGIMVDLDEGFTVTVPSRGLVLQDTDTDGVTA